LKWQSQEIEARIAQIKININQYAARITNLNNQQMMQKLDVDQDAMTCVYTRDLGDQLHALAPALRRS